MATYHASVKKALAASQQDLIDHKEHCSADPVKLATVGRKCGHQVRIKRNDSEYGLYTVSRVYQESPDNIVRMGSTGWKRLGTSEEFVGSLDSQVPHPCRSRKVRPVDSRGEAESAQYPMRCLRSSTCLELMSPICSSRGAGLKRRTCFSVISSTLP